MPACLYQWLDRVPDLPGLARTDPISFPYLLQSAAGGMLGGHSLLLQADGPALVLHRGRGIAGPGSGPSFFERLDSWFREESAEPSKVPKAEPALPFIGGWFIYLGYEVAVEIEPSLDLPGHNSALPDAIAHRCPAAIIVFHGQGEEADRAVAVAESSELLAGLLDRVTGQGHAADGPVAPAAELETLAEEDPERFKEAVRRIHEYLRAGDVFQVNVSRPWSGRFRQQPNAWHLYDLLRRANPAPFAGMMRWDGHHLLSSSPERLVQIRGTTVQTRPIAGTRPRGQNSVQDRDLSEELLANLKERAEHIMLIDLERNDLGRVCRAGSVEVSELMVVESYAHVHHIVSNVRGELADNAGPVDAMKAVFPGGTITGCPKVRCMEIIAELEGEGRSFYTGSMGYLGRDGNMDLNILIRSMLVSGRQFTFRTGAGIVADSNPEQELLETADKARGMLLALETYGRETRYA